MKAALNFLFRRFFFFRYILRHEYISYIHSAVFIQIPINFLSPIQHNCELQLELPLSNLTAACGMCGMVIQKLLEIRPSLQLSDIRRLV